MVSSPSSSSGCGGPVILDLEFGTVNVKKSGTNDDDDGNDDEECGDSRRRRENYGNFNSSDSEDVAVDNHDDGVFHSSNIVDDELFEDEDDSNIERSADDNNNSASSPHKSLTQFGFCHNSKSDDNKNNDNDGADENHIDVKSSKLWDTILSSQNYHSAACPSSLSDHHNTNKHVVPTLRRIAGMTIASHLEHIPPGVLGVALSESHWKTIVKYRHDYWGGRNNNKNDDRERSTQFSNQQHHQQQQHHRHRIQQLALPEKILIAIEQHPNNTHISQSHSADVYFWSEIVNKSYPNIGGISRPITLSYPITFIKDRLIQLGHELLNLLVTPITKEEYKRMNELSRVDNDHVYKNTDNNGDDNDQEEEYSIKLIDGDNDNGRCVVSTSNVQCYERNMKLQTKHRTKALQRVIHELHQLPMDSTLLSQTGIGKTMTKAIKILKKLVKQMKPKINDNYTMDDDDDDEMEQLLLGYPTFWKGIWVGISNGTALTKESLLTQLQQLLQEWKDNVSSENNIFNLDSNNTSTMTTTKRKIGTDDAIIVVPSSKRGRDHKVSAAQHSIDMKLLHASPDWRTLLQSLRTRESDLKKLHGDRVRSRREDLEKHRPKIGKVVLRTTMAVGRDCDSSRSGLLLKHPTPQPTKRQDDILSKSRGHRARMQQLAKSTSSSSSTAAGGTSNGALARIRTESKVAALWSKSSFGGKSASKLSFGASVASASSTGVSHTAKVQQHLQGKSKIHVALGNGKRMTLPPSSSFFTGAAARGKTAVVDGPKVPLELSVQHKEAKTTKRSASTSLSQVDREKESRKVAAIEKKKR